MKNIFCSARHCKGNDFIPKHQFNTLRFDAFIIIGSIIITIGFLFTGCKKENRDSNEFEIQHNNQHDDQSGGNMLIHYPRLSPRTVWELLQARAHTARYRDIRKAIRDGYATIDVVVENMGHHYMKSALVDATFDFRKPEILVYNKEEDGDFTLVAVEYAVPISETPNVAPSGFTGSADVWDRNTGFGLWLLHAWVWHYNPAGVFNPTNPLIHVH